MRGIGVDVVSVPAVAAILDEAGETFLARVFTGPERAAFPDGRLRPAHVASRFAVKEAVFKCLRVPWPEQAGFTDIVVTSGCGEPPVVELRGAFAGLVTGPVLVSLSTTADTAVAVAMLG